MQRSELKTMDCSVAQTLDVVADWWSFLILRDCFHGIQTFDAFQRDLEISTSLLTVRLKHLVALGVLERQQSKTDGRSFKYRLTEKGLDLYPLIVGMMQWGEKWSKNGRGPRIELIERDTGHPIQGAYVLSQDGRTLAPSDVIARPGTGADEKMRKLISQRDEPLA